MKKNLKSSAIPKQTQHKIYLMALDGGLNLSSEITLLHSIYVGIYYIKGVVPPRSQPSFSHSLNISLTRKHGTKYNRNKSMNEWYNRAAKVHVVYELGYTATSTLLVPTSRIFFHDSPMHYYLISILHRFFSSLHSFVYALHHLVAGTSAAS